MSRQDPYLNLESRPVFLLKWLEFHRISEPLCRRNLTMICSSSSHTRAMTAALNAKRFQKKLVRTKLTKRLSESQARRFLKAARKDLVQPCLSLFSIFDSKSLSVKRKSQRCFVSACRFWNGWKCLSTPCNIVPVGLIVSGHRGHAYFAGKRFYFGCGGGTDACLMPFDSSLYLPMFHTPLRQLNHGSRFFFAISLSLSLFLSLSLSLSLSRLHGIGVLPWIFVAF